MTLEIEIPYGQYWSTPFCKWQGAFQHLHSLEFAAFVAKQELARRRLPLDLIDYAVLGTTIPQHHAFYGLPWLTGLLGAAALTGPTLSQACRRAKPSRRRRHWWIVTPQSSRASEPQLTEMMHRGPVIRWWRLPTVRSRIDRS